MAYGYSCTIHVVYKGCNGHVEIDREEREMLECIYLHAPSIPIRILYRYTYLLLLWLYKALSQTFIESTKVSACNQSDSTVAF